MKLSMNANDFLPVHYQSSENFSLLCVINRVIPCLKDIYYELSGEQFLIQYIRILL